MNYSNCIIQAWAARELGITLHMLTGKKIQLGATATQSYGDGGGKEVIWLWHCASVDGDNNISSHFELVSKVGCRPPYISAMQHTL